MSIKSQYHYNHSLDTHWRCHVTLLIVLMSLWFSLGLCLLVHKNRTRPTLRGCSYVDDSNMRAMFVAYFMLLSLDLHVKKKPCVCSESFNISLGESWTSLPPLQRRESLLWITFHQPPYEPLCSVCHGYCFLYRFMLKFILYVGNKFNK